MRINDFFVFFYSHPELKEGGALQLTLSQLQLDFYPYHWAAAEAGTNRQHWLRYEEGPLARWVQQAVDQFAKQLLHMDSPLHSKLTRTGGPDTGGHPQPRPPPSGSHLQDSILNHLRQLMSQCLVLRLGDLLVYRVSTSKLRSSPKEFIVGKKQSCAQYFSFCASSGVAVLVINAFAHMSRFYCAVLICLAYLLTEERKPKRSAGTVSTIRIIRASCLLFLFNSSICVISTEPFVWLPSLQVIEQNIHFLRGFLFFISS